MKKLPPKKTGSIFHVSFEIALLLKATNALLEVIGGVLLVFLNPGAAHSLIEQITKKELAEDPKDIIANALIHLGEKFSISAQHFGIFYLLSHGTLKLILVYLLWRKKLWAYPMAVILLCLFVAYQIYKFTLTGSGMMVFLTVLDVIVILLTLIEYRHQMHK